jgi:hypothetical protein
MTNPENREKIEQELAQARRSQADGNEGKARVCARRAAGWAIELHLAATGAGIDSSSALDQIKHLAGLQGYPEQVYQVLHHLTVKMEKDSLDSDAYYPIEGVDLVAEAAWLVETLLGAG